MKKLLKTAAALLLAVVLAAGGYVGYVFSNYTRLEDNLALEICGEADGVLAVGEEYKAVTWNIGFGAYSPDYSFFMDGGEESRAYSRDAVMHNTETVIETLGRIGADFMLLQEVDVDATRSYHVDQSAMICENFGKMDGVFAQNYDSPYLLYPVLEPHGASKSGLLTLAGAEIGSSLRRSLPVESGFMKLVDLDRCYSVSRIPVENGRTLCLYNLHLSAYTSDGTIATEQLMLLVADMLREYEAGNYVIAGGDFNKDLPGNSPEIFEGPDEVYTWTQPLDRDLLQEGLLLADSVNAEAPVPSCRNADRPYVPGESFVVTVDGFIVSDNVEILECCVVDEGFAASDHNPVILGFSLGEQA